MQSYMGRVAMALVTTLASVAATETVAGAGSQSLSREVELEREVFCKEHDEMWHGKEANDHETSELTAQEGSNSAMMMLNARKVKSMKLRSSVQQNRSVLHLAQTRPAFRAHRGHWPNFQWRNSASHVKEVPQARVQQHIQLMGLFDSGTNLLRAVIEKNFPREQVFVHEMYKPARNYWKMQWQPNCTETAHEICSFWKHASLDQIKRRSPKRLDEMHELDVVGIAMVRHPLSWLQSIRAAPYAFGWPPNNVHGENWFRNKITVPKDYYGGPPLVHYPSLVDVWNNQTFAYENLGSYGFKRFLAIRYEDLVLNIERVVADIAAVLGVTAPDIVQEVQDPAKTGVCNGRETALTKILTKTYLTMYEADERQSACGLLDVSLMRRHGYVDCDDVAPGNAM